MSKLRQILCKSRVAVRPSQFRLLSFQGRLTFARCGSGLVTSQVAHFNMRRSCLQIEVEIGCAELRLGQG